jgi:hypothetical protein
LAAIAKNAEQRTGIRQNPNSNIETETRLELTAESGQRLGSSDVTRKIVSQFGSYQNSHRFMYNKHIIQGNVAR